MSDFDPKKYSILIVDDQEELREAISFELEMHGFQIHTADNGNSAWEIIQSRKVDLVVSDIRMPDCDGIELLERIKDKKPGIPVILVTGYADITPEDAIGKGAETVLKKPFEPSIIFKSVKKALGGDNSR